MQQATAEVSSDTLSIALSGEYFDGNLASRAWCSKQCDNLFAQLQSIFMMAHLLCRALSADVSWASRLSQLTGFCCGDNC